MAYLLGKKRAIHDLRTLPFHKYSLLTRRQIPPGVNWKNAVDPKPVLLNDSLGDCTVAGAGHMIRQWTKLATGTEVVVTDPQILKAYEAVSGYTPGNPATDTGAYLIDVLKYWRATGIGGHRIDAFVSVNPMLQTVARAGMYLFGNLYIGLALPVSAQDQIGSCWLVPPGGPVGNALPGSWGGHAVAVMQCDQHGLTVDTWGQWQRMDWNFFRTYCDEAWCVLAKDWIENSGLSPGLFNYAALSHDLTAISGSGLRADFR